MLLEYKCTPRKHGAKKSKSVARNKTGGLRRIYVVMFLLFVVVAPNRSGIRRKLTRTILRREQECATYPRRVGSDIRPLMYIRGI